MKSNAVTWEDYKRWLGSEALQPPQQPAPAVIDLMTDSRTIKPGAWFVPLSGESFDGHRFITQALASGAAGFFYAASRAAELSAAERALGLAVEDPLAAMQKATSGWRRQLTHLKVLALTGSAGKTTTKDMLSRILSANAATLATTANFNNEIGVPKTLQLLQPDHRYAVLEFGARRPGNIKFLCELASPNVTGLLNVGQAHLGIFGSIDKLIATKLEIFRNSPADAIQVANFDDPRILAGAKTTGKTTLTFGIGAGADVRVEACDWLPQGSGMKVKLRALGQGVAFETGVAHAMLAVNAAAAAAMALAAGAKADDIATGLNGFSGAAGRYQILRIGRMAVIDDSYNANPESLASGLQTVQRSYQGQRIGLVVGDMLELGDTSLAEHHRIGLEAIAPLQPDLLVTVGTEAVAFAKGARDGGLAPGKISSFATVAALIQAALAFEQRCDVLYIKGSNGIKLSKLIDALRTSAVGKA